MAKSKVTTVEEAIKKYCFDGMSVLLPGFVNVGVSEVLIEGLIAAGIKDLSVISNNTSIPGRGIGKLVRANVIKAITCSHIGNNSETVQKVVDGEINLTFVPQGSLCEKVRAGGCRHRRRFDPHRPVHPHDGRQAGRGVGREGR